MPYLLLYLVCHFCPTLNVVALNVVAFYAAVNAVS